MTSNDAKNFLRFLKKLLSVYRKKNSTLLQIITAHKHGIFKEWLERNKKRIQIYHTPTYSSWLNQVDIWFNILSKDVLKDAVWHSKQQLVDQLMEYIKTYNKERAKPFQWTNHPPSNLLTY